MAQEQVITVRDGQVKVTILNDNEVSIDRIAAYLIKNSFAAQISNKDDNTPTVPKDVKDILIKDVEKK